MVFDIAGPIIVQSVARNQGASVTVALAVSGAPPAAWILISMLWRRRVDAVGVFVLSSIILATLIGLATGSGRLYLLDGAILTGVFGLVCPASLATPRPLMCHFALSSNGGIESQKGERVRRSLALCGVSARVRGHDRGLGGRERTPFLGPRRVRVGGYESVARSCRPGRLGLLPGFGREGERDRRRGAERRSREA